MLELRFTIPFTGKVLSIKLEPKPPAPEPYLRWHDRLIRVDQCGHVMVEYCADYEHTKHVVAQL
jgi:hypothetical protein